MTYMQAALTILAHADRPLTVPELTSVAVAEGLVRPRGKTPDRTMSSVLYRRLAGDPDAPIINRAGRFWLRERPLPTDETEYLTCRARRARPAVRRPSGLKNAHVPRHATVLPAPPLSLPREAVTTAGSATQRPDYAPVRRERAVTRAGERGGRVLARLATRRAREGAWDVATTDRRLVVPLLTHLGYRGVTSTTVLAGKRGALAYDLRVDSVPIIVLHVRRLAHDLDADDAWRALGHAHELGAPYAAVTNGRELRLYAVAMAEAQDDADAALALLLDLAPAPAGSAFAAEQAGVLWLLRRDSVAAGALDAYVVDKAVGAALAGALDVPDSPLARVLTAEVRARLGVAVPAALVARHARLALRGRRGRDGEPLPADVATVAAVRGPRLRPSVVGVVQSA